MFHNGINHLGSILSGLSANQKVISNNIANAHTPGYARQEQTFTDVLGRLTNPFETKLSREMGSALQSPMLSAGTGEPVDLAIEMVDMQKNYLNYNMSTRRLTSIITSINKSAQIGR